jgi:beta-lactamase regulating signal transducer with metallopeptidase domain
MLRVVSWLLTYALHSLLIISMVFVLLKTFPKLRLQAKEWLLKTALVAGIFTASIAMVAQWQIWHINLAPISTQTRQLSATPKPNTAQVRVAHLATTNTPQLKVNPTRPPWYKVLLSLKWYQVALMVWFYIASVLLFRLQEKKQRFLRSIQYSTIPALHLEASLKKLQNSLGIRHHIELRLIDNNLSPLVLNKHTLLVPAKVLEKLNLAQQESMLAHELAHIKRRDDLWLRVYQGIKTVLFFQPLNYWVYKQMYQTAEYACDAWASKVTDNQHAMAQCLVEVAEWLLKPNQWAMGMAARPHLLTKRVKKLLNNQTMTQEKNYSPLLLVAVITLVGIFALFIFPTLGIEQKPVAKVPKTTQTKYKTVLRRMVIAELENEHAYKTIGQRIALEKAIKVAIKKSMHKIDKELPQLRFKLAKSDHLQEEKIQKEIKDCLAKMKFNKLLWESHTKKQKQLEAQRKAMIIERMQQKVLEFG